MKTLSIATDGHLSETGFVSMFWAGYISFFQQTIESTGRIFQTFSQGGSSSKEDKIKFIRAIDEMEIPIIANFVIQYIYKNYLKD
jgi:hypothetical protein